MKTLAFLFLTAQAVSWTDCAEGVFCAVKEDCASECGDCCDQSCSHLEPQFDVLGEGMSIVVVLVSTPVDAPVFTAPDQDVERAIDGRPPPLLERPLYAFLS